MAPRVAGASARGAVLVVGGGWIQELQLVGPTAQLLTVTFLANTEATTEHTTIPARHISAYYFRVPRMGDAAMQ